MQAGSTGSTKKNKEQQWASLFFADDVHISAGLTTAILGKKIDQKGLRWGMTITTASVVAHMLAAAYDMAR